MGTQGRQQAHLIRVAGFALALAGFLLSGGPRPLAAQTFQGRVLEEGSDRAVATALVRLIDQDGVDRGISVADSTGFYRVEAPEPGVYRLEADRIGYDGFTTPRLEALRVDGVYPIDLVLRKAPIPIRGLTVSTDRAFKQMQLMIGMHPSSLRRAPIGPVDIQDNLDKGHDLADLLRWSNTPSLLVFRTADGPCFTLRGGGCLPVYFNGVRYQQRVLDVVPLDMIYSVVVLYRGETLTYPNGAVLLFSEAWLR
jgi:Carboxypeptidase regulatory-like domain